VKAAAGKNIQKELHGVGLSAVLNKKFTSLIHFNFSLILVMRIAALCHSTETFLKQFFFTLKNTLDKRADQREYVLLHY
jgi:hypothetical protein